MKFVYGKKLFEKFYELSKVKERVYIISAYVGNNSYELLSPNVKDIKDVRFIVNFSRASVQAGAISPNGIRQLKTIGDVHTRKDLHAKVYLFDNVAIISSANFSRNAFENNLEVGIIINKPPIIVRKIEKFFDKLWKKSKPVSTAYIDEMEKVQKQYKNLRQKHGIPESEASSKPKKPKITIPKWEEPTELKKKHIIIKVNWSPHKFKKICSQSEKKSDEQLRCCHEAEDCIDWGAGEGCASSLLFKKYKYATSRKAIKKGRIAFFIARNPNLNGNYYLVGFLLMASDKPTGSKYWGKQKVYSFKGDPDFSVRLPSIGKKVVVFDRKFTSKLYNFVDWNKKPSNWKDASWIGNCVHKNPRYISEENAKILLEECYAKTGHETIKQILEEDF